MIRVKATREGMAGRMAATGWIIDNLIPYVALPSRRALHRFVRVRNPRNQTECFAIVLDLGPWNVSDDKYVYDGARPQAESGTDMTGRPTNKAGIDLGEKVWHQLGMVDNNEVEWEFVV
jgi:hypothetical protein